MSAYSDYDPVILKWIEHLQATLFTEWSGAPARFFYIPGDPPFEAFQISVELRQNECVAVHACAVDTNDGADDEMDVCWEGAALDLDRMISLAVETVNRWKARGINQDRHA